MHLLTRAKSQWTSRRRQIRSTNPIELLNKEIERRTPVVGVFPRRVSLIRLVGTVLAERHDARQDRRATSARSRCPDL